MQQNNSPRVDKALLGEELHCPKNQPRVEDEQRVLGEESTTQNAMDALAAISPQTVVFCPETTTAQIEVLPCDDSSDVHQLSPF